MKLEEEGGRAGRDASRGSRTRGPHVVTLEALGVGWWELGESEGEGTAEKGSSGRENEFPTRKPGFFLDWKQTRSVLGAWPVLHQRPSEWFSKGAQRDGERC